MTDQASRIARLEVKVDHNIKHFEQNDLDHKLILERINDLEISLLIYRRIVYFTAAIIGAAAGFIIKYYDFLIHRLGH